MISFDFNAYPLADYLDVLLKDYASGRNDRNIILATTSYGLDERTELTPDLVHELDIRPRILKSKEEQARRTARF